MACVPAAARKRLLLLLLARRMLHHSLRLPAGPAADLVHHTVTCAHVPHLWQLSPPLSASVHHNDFQGTLPKSLAKMQHLLR